MDAASTTAPDVIAGEASSSVAPPLARVPLVLNKRNFDWVTNRIAGAVEGGTPRWWWVSFAITVDDRGRRPVLPRLPDLHRRRRLGIESSGRLGLGHHQLRLLDRYRSRRHAHLRHPVPVPPEVAHVDQPLGRSDDDLRGHLRRRSSRASTSAASGWRGSSRRSRTNTRIWPNFRIAAALGRVRGLDLLHGLGALLVHRPDS